MKRLLLVALVASLTACASSGRNFNSHNLVKLEPGRTSFDQARTLLGAPPVQTVLAPSGNSVSYWRFIRANGFSGNTSIREAGLVFTPDGTFLRILQLQNIDLSQADRHRLMVLPATNASTAVAPQTQSQPARSQEQQLQELQSTPGLGYEEYMRRYKAIMEH
ncbi:hypothetical protein [Pseudomonas paralcaligenes]|uniref:hypothetical protein n=1 Tax=Pseudomonas paralcaligenes TaxID=2772558 RepID=UPI001C7F98BC|nr:hypothetical protein [Pseudomonas paralcaligenes]